MIVYKITNQINGKIYVGLTTQKITNRFRSHVYAAVNRPEDSHCKALSCAIRKYGESNFNVEKIDEALTKKDLSDREIDWIKKLNCMSPNGYNLTTGGELGFTRNKSSIDQMVKTRKENVLSGKSKPLGRWKPLRGESLKSMSMNKSRIYVLKSPDGLIYKIHGLISFCEKMGISRSGLSKVHSGSRKSSCGWVKPSIVEIEEEPNIISYTNWGEK